MNKVFIKALLEKKAKGGYSVIASTSTIDRSGDSIDQAGWDLKNFMLNPVMLWAHDYSALPVAKATSIVVDGRGLVADYEFAPPEGNPMAQQVKTLVDEGFLNAVSVGFMPLERNGNVITKMELFEISFVPVPANPQALQLMLSKGIASDVLTKFFDVKEAEVAAAQAEVDKGAVADEVAAEEAMEQKYTKMQEVWEVLGAFCQVYFDEATGVDAFASLLKETIALLGTVAENGGASDDITAALKESLTKAIGKDAVKDLMTKIGASHSKATKEAIGKAIEHLETSTVLLKELVSSKESDTDTGEAEPAAEEKPAETATEEKNVDVVRSLLITRNLLREDETGSRSALGAVNALIAKQRQPVLAK